MIVLTYRCSDNRSPTINGITDGLTITRAVAYDSKCYKSVLQCCHYTLHYIHMYIPKQLVLWLINALQAPAIGSSPLMIVLMITSSTRDTRARTNTNYLHISLTHCTTN